MFIVNSVNSLCHPLPSLYMSTFKLISKSAKWLIRGLFLIRKASVIWRATWHSRITVIIFLIAFTRAVINAARASHYNMRGNAPKTRSIGIIPLGLAVLFTALITIYSFSSFGRSGNSFSRILYAYLSST